MKFPSETTQQEKGSSISSENAVEMVRLMKLHTLLTTRLGGLLPEQLNLAPMKDILDIGSGPGGWVLDVAHLSQHFKVTGIDVNTAMVTCARIQAQSQGLDNAQFYEMDALKPLDFPDSSFDLVNARFIASFVPRLAWPALLQECQRITRPGGILCLTEAEALITNSHACEHFSRICTRILKQAGRSFSPDGQHLCITPMLAHFLRTIGYHHIQKQAYAIDCSSGEDAHWDCYKQFEVLPALLQPFLLKMGVLSRSELERLHQQIIFEMLQEEFCGLWFVLTVWGQRTQ